jgi:hypothetical protein
MKSYRKAENFKGSPQALTRNQVADEPGAKQWRIGACSPVSPSLTQQTAK